MLFTVTAPELKCTFVLKTWNVCDITREVRKILSLLVSVIYLFLSLLPIKSFFSPPQLLIKNPKICRYIFLNNSFLNEMIPRFLT